MHIHFTAKLMLTRWERAHHTKVVAEETFSNLMPGIDCMHGNPCTLYTYNKSIIAQGLLQRVQLFYGFLKKGTPVKPPQCKNNIPSHVYTYLERWQYRYTETLQLYESLRQVYSYLP